MQNKLQVFLPYPKSTIAQRFGENANYSYARDGLKGHTAYDWSVPWGTPIPNCTADAYCYSVMNKDNIDPSRYRAVFMLVETETGLYEVSYGHCSTIYAEVGKTYQVGDTIALVGNTGDVFDGSHEVTRMERENGSHAGAHLHGPQIRPVTRSKDILPHKQYLSDGDGFYEKDGFYFEVIDYDNGYHGCVSLAPFSTETVATKQVDTAVVASIVEDTSKALEQVQNLPQNQQLPFLDRIKSILLAVLPFLKG